MKNKVQDSEQDRNGVADTCAFLSKGSGERANTSLSADGFPCEHLFPYSTSTNPPLQPSSGLYSVQICHIRGEDIQIFPSLPTRTHPHEDDSDWYVQANCLPRQHLKCALRKPFFQCPLFCSTCKMEIIPEGAEVHILENCVQLSLSAQRRAGRGMPALPVLCPGWTQAPDLPQKPYHPAGSKPMRLYQS